MFLVGLFCFVFVCFLGFVLLLFYFFFFFWMCVYKYLKIYFFQNGCGRFSVELHIKESCYPCQGCSDPCLLKLSPRSNVHTTEWHKILCSESSETLLIKAVFLLPQESGIHSRTLFSHGFCTLKYNTFPLPPNLFWSTFEKGVICWQCLFQGLCLSHWYSKIYNCTDFQHSVSKQVN